MMQTSGLNPPVLFQPPVTPSDSLSRGHLKPSSPIRHQHRALVLMGSCMWQGVNGFQCPCSSGSCVSGFDETGAAAFISPSINPRTDLVDELIARVNSYHIIRVNGTPASGKTTVMRLLANKLLEDYGQTTPIYVFSGWDSKEVHRAGGWAAYLKQMTGVRGQDWSAYHAYLLLDEAQQSFWNDELWADLFKSIEPWSSPFIVLFMSYGSPNRGCVGIDEQAHIKTPMTFGSGQCISLRPSKDVGDTGLGRMRFWKPVGLLLDENEAIDVVTRYASTSLQPSPSLTPDLKKGFFLTSNGHVGLLTSLIRVLQDVPPTASKILFSQPLKFFRIVRHYPFTRGLPRSNTLQRSAFARVFKAAIACNGISESSLWTESEELKDALLNICRNGWLHAEETDDDTHYIFASQIHRWYCQCLFTQTAPDNDIAYDTPLRLAVDAIKHFQPRRLSDAPRSLAGASSPLEDQYQKEFYRCLFPILDGHVILSPEYVINLGITKGGTIDFLVARKKWGLELLRDRDRLVEHMKRFESGGQYFSMIQSGDMERYIVLDFTSVPPKKPRPEYRDRLYHVVFSQNYRQVEIIDASDLSIVTSFALMENATPVA
ncbi:hypothetical protein BO78DRAFT_435397 [Aspergillus sclerotiicarbonarius CBS 121057]|uniref:Uncharacterized protein n=1 Tax=Aspergillus sclerotiicarbonarius (strain CBS 121057 / IBT 28362) TaxID=1448318 RepID=A0A319EKV0_ASPSB|nr:hypothetical protein BO78DRAFT_435397 [Aspergillus sclerotiicarbonarius CBS 121057]